ncbi:MAG: TIR domain-containing protein [Anaerolineae bacterium]|nr:TIR domain-containing protein [Anaerolineae bacterium]
MKIFISYSSKNRDHAKVLSSDLDVLGHDVWFDENVSGGQSWWDAILHRVRECELFIFILTQDSLDSKACEAEYVYGAQLNKPILPVRMGDISVSLLPPELSKTQMVDYRSADKKAALALSKAINLLPPRQLLPEPMPPPPPAPISPLGKLNAELDLPSIDRHRQASLLIEIQEFLQRPSERSDAVKLLRKLRGRDDTLSRYSDEIDQILKDVEAQDKSRRRQTIPAQISPWLRIFIIVVVGWSIAGVVFTGTLWLNVTDWRFQPNVFSLLFRILGGGIAGISVYFALRQKYPIVSTQYRWQLVRSWALVWAIGYGAKLLLPSLLGGFYPYYDNDLNWTVGTTATALLEGLAGGIVTGTILHIAFPTLASANRQRIVGYWILAYAPQAIANLTIDPASGIASINLNIILNILCGLIGIALTLRELQQLNVA